MPSLPFAVVPVPLGTITTGNETAAKPAIHLGEFKHIGMTWRSSDGTNLWVRGNLGSAQPIDFMSLVGASANSGTTIRLRLGDTQAAVDGTASYDSGAVTLINPLIARDDGLYGSHLELPSLQTRQWWRIDISHGAAFEAAALILGKRITPSTFYDPSFEYGVEDRGSIEISRYGVPEESAGIIMRALKFKLGWLSETDFETKFRPLDEKLGRRGIAFWCFDPAANSYRQARTYLGWLKDPPYATGGVNNTRYSKDYSILSVI
jgi:hypothetical protein